MDTSELKKAAQAATPGPWYASDAFADNGEFSGVDIVSQGGTVLLSEDDGPGGLDAYYIAAANPAAVLALIESHEQLVVALRETMAAASGYLDDEHGVPPDGKEWYEKAKAALAAVSAA